MSINARDINPRANGTAEADLTRRAGDDANNLKRGVTELHRIAQLDVQLSRDGSVDDREASLGKATPSLDRIRADLTVIGKAAFECA